MTALDTNLLLFAYSAASPWHERARQFLESVSAREDIAVSEFTLTEFYVLLRNPAVLQRPLTAAEAVTVIRNYRHHPRWRILGYPPGSLELHEALWRLASAPDFACRRIYDARAALSLQAFGVRNLATANVKDFIGLGFERVWNPLDGE